MQLSYWEKNSFFNHTDVVIIGSGIVGLHAAIYIREKYPTLQVMILEKGFLPYGASTRNAGFACFGSAGELLKDLENMTEQEVFMLVEKRFIGLQKLRKGLGDEHLGYEPLGGFEVFTGEEKKYFEACLDKLNWLNSMLESITKIKETFVPADEMISKNGLNGFANCIKNKCEGQVDTGLMMFNLVQRARKAGVLLLNGLGVKNMMETGNGVEIETDQAFSFCCSKVLVTTNGFARQLLPEIDLQPARAQVLITSEIPGLKLKGAFHYQEGYYYFRNVGKRVLFGGGRNLDFKAEQTTDFGMTNLVQQQLEKILKEMILPGVNYEIEQRWSGIMGLGSSKSTIVKMISQNIGCAVRLGGMGVAIGSLVGEEGGELLFS